MTKSGRLFRKWYRSFRGAGYFLADKKDLRWLARSELKRLRRTFGGMRHAGACWKYIPHWRIHEAYKNWKYKKRR